MAFWEDYKDHTIQFFRQNPDVDPTEFNKRFEEVLENCITAQMAIDTENMMAAGRAKMEVPNE